MTAAPLPVRRWLTAALLLVVAMAGVLGPMVPAPAAAAAYRYWTYWTSPGTGWTFSQVGPASAVPKHGAVEGWRFALSTGTRGQGAQPRIAPAAAFSQFCGPADAAAGKKRVAVVFDFGVAADAPEGQSAPQPRGTCVEIEKGATGGDILTRAADVRVESGLVCAIGGYPKGECAPAVATPTPKPDRDDGGKDPRPDRPDDSSDTGDRDPPPAADPSTPDPRDEDPGADASDDSRSTPPAAEKSPAPRRSTAPESTPTPSTTALPAVPSTVPSASASPVFIAADAHTDEGSTGPRWSLAAAVLALGGLGAYLLVRRRPRRR